MAININRSINDPFYRYKMPRLQAKVEGKGNGIKTVVSNMVDIAKALERPPMYPTKYFGCELGAQVNADLKNDRYIVNGEHGADKLQELLDGFIKKFVLCTACENPETSLFVKNQIVRSKCKACGHAYVIGGKHRLLAFILKNPPINNDVYEKEDKDPSGNGAEDGAFAALKNSPVHDDGDDDDDWAEPTEEEKLASHIGKLVMDKDLDKSEEERLDMLHGYFLAAKKQGTITDARAMVDEAERLELKTKAPLLLADVLFDRDILSQLEKYRTLLLRFLEDDQKGQRHLLGGIEQLIHRHADVLLPRAKFILKALYDQDLVDEEVILAWAAKPSKKYVKKDFAKSIIKECSDVIKWLEEAEEEDSTDASDSDIEFDERARVVGVVKKVAPPAVSAVNGSATIVKNSDDEIDIDDI